MHLANPSILLEVSTMQSGALPVLEAAFKCDRDSAKFENSEEFKQSVGFVFKVDLD